MRENSIGSLFSLRSMGGEACLMALPLPRFFLCCLVFLLAGCSPDDKASEVESEDVELKVGMTDPDQQGGGGAELAEEWSAMVKAQLIVIEGALAKSASHGAEGDAALLETVRMTDVEHYENKDLYRGDLLEIVELSARGAFVEVTKSEFMDQVRTLLLLGPDSQEEEVHFKLFGIEWEGEHLVTKQRLTATGSRDGNEVKSSGVVNAIWSTPTETDQPKLISFSLAKFVQSERTSTGNPAFEDFTSVVMGGNDSWSEQLQFGMNTWGRSIEHSLNPDFLGYHGLAIGDVDGDGLEDLYLCQPGGLPNLLFRQTPDGKMTDISAVAGVDILDNSTGALLVDVDNDGDADLAVATKAAFLVMENDGTGKFTLRGRHPEIGLGYSPTAADYDLDGDLDLFVLGYGATGSDIGDFPTPHPFRDARNGGANILLENQGGFRFLDATERCGLGAGNHRFSFAASWEDFDNDGLLDVYIANDFGPNQFFRNEGKRFKDVSVQSGSQDWGFGMSAAWADYDRDGHMDLYVSNMFSSAGNQIVPRANFYPTLSEETRKKYLKMVRGNSLLRNSGSGSFSDVTDPMNEGFGGWAWGSQFADLNNDGWEDLYVANGYITQEDEDDL
jgi:hypothetical protein